MSGAPRDVARMRVSIISVGDELISGRVVDRHAATASARLTALGAAVVSHRTVGDREGDLAAALRQDVAGSDVVLITGGLGPTEDDRTREEVASAAGVKLEFREEWWDRIAERFRRYGLDPSDRNRRQAFFPETAEGVENRFGSAPAFRLRIDNTEVWSLPGVPDEFQGILDEVVIPALEPRLTPPAVERVWTFYGVPESALDGWVVDQLKAEGLPPDHHICVRDGEIELRISADFDLLPRARAEFGSRCLGGGEANLATRVVAEARDRRGTIAIAESCTGGIIAGRLTDVAGCSAVFQQSWVTYANEAKTQELGVPSELFIEHGAVSAPVAEALAQGARVRARSDWAVSTTGIAGPSGGTNEKPVGLIWFGIATADGVVSGQRRFRGDRARIRSYGATQAFSSLLAAIRGEDPFPWRSDS